MSCEGRQEEAGAWIDGELPEAQQVALFRHLESCPECRGHLDWLFRHRRLLRNDREALMTEAERLPSAAELFGGTSERVTSRSVRRLPLPIGIAAALLLGLAGLYLGTRLSHPRSGAAEHTAGTTAPSVVVVYGLPEVEVRGTDVRP